MLMALRTAALAANDQCVQPVFASSEYTWPFWLPTNTRPAATTGCDHADVASGKPKAHFSLSFGTSEALSPACAAGWNRVLVTSTPHPFHRGDRAGSARGGDVAQRPTVDAGPASLIVRRVRNSAMARRSSTLSLAPCTCIVPLVSARTMASGALASRLWRPGARESAAPLWQVAH